MKYASMPKFSILPPISDEILLRLCSDDLIQILIKLARFLTLWTKPFLEGFVWSNKSITVVISRLQFALTCRFLARINFFRLDLSVDLNKSHQFTNFNFCDVTLYHSINSSYNLTNLDLLSSVCLCTRKPTSSVQSEYSLDSLLQSGSANTSVYFQCLLKKQLKDWILKWPRRPGNYWHSQTIVTSFNRVTPTNQAILFILGFPVTMYMTSINWVTSIRLKKWVNRHRSINLVTPVILVVTPRKIVATPINLLWHPLILYNTY